MSRAAGVHIRGDGIAARCCEHLLTRAGIAVSVHACERPRLPAILLSDSALALIRDVFENDALFRDAFAITRRGVAWTRGVEPVVLPHRGVVVSEKTLLDAVRPAGGRAEVTHADWTVHAARPLPAGVEEHRFGSRMAAGVPVQLAADGRERACWMEAVEDGWLFLLPDSEERGWLLATGGRAEQLLNSSRVIAGKIRGYLPAAGEFAASPRIAWPLCGAEWIACGTAAMAFDPICGDGTAHAVREGILASAVIQAQLRGEALEPLLGHYQGRLLAGFGRHLAMCREFYRMGFGGPWWEAELASVESGLEWCRLRTEEGSGFQYRLHGFELEAVR